MVDQPWTNKQLTRLGKCIRDELEPPAALPSYDDVMSFYNDVAVDVQSRIDELDFEPLLGERKVKVTSRPKTIDTLQQKLRREYGIQLPYIQDIAGVRAEAEMSLDEQDGVVNAIVGAFAHDASSVHDLRDAPHSGYRAVHIRLSFPTRVEVQVRTRLQGLWANMYEVAADIYGRDIRYGCLPADEKARETVEFLHMISSDEIATIEEIKNDIVRQNAELESLQRSIAGAPRLVAYPLKARHRRAKKMNNKAYSTVESLEQALQKNLLTLTDTFIRMREEVANV